MINSFYFYFIINMNKKLTRIFNNFIYIIDFNMRPFYKSFNIKHYPHLPGPTYLFKSTTLSCPFIILVILYELVVTRFIKVLDKVLDLVHYTLENVFCINVSYRYQ